MFGPCSRAEDQCILIRNNLKPRTMSTIAAYIIGFNSEIWMQKNDAPRKMGKEGGGGGEGGEQKEKNGVEQPLAAQHADGRGAQLQN